MNADVLIGCCGWTEAHRKYFTDFPVIELQSTFYQPPSPELAEKWRREAPADFIFTLKAWQLITHPASSPTYRKLKTAIDPKKAHRYGHFRPTEEVWEAWQATKSIAEALQAAGIVFQCPPGFGPTEENCANLEEFSRPIKRRNWLIAWEPRGRWEPDVVRDLCRRLDLVHCVDPFTAEPVHGQPIYFRLHGRGRYRYSYTDEDLADLRKTCERHRDAGHSPIYVLFNNTDMRQDALRFKSLMAGSR